MSLYEPKEDNPELHALQSSWYIQLDQVLCDIRTSQGEAIDKAATSIVRAVIGGGVCHIYDTGHMLTHELIGRAGGLMLFTPISVELTLRHPVRNRPGSHGRTRIHMEDVEGIADYIMSQADCRAGDVLLLGSVSGASPLPVALALAARKVGMEVVALTSIAASNAVDPHHSSGKRLYEVADIVLDQQTRPGDALVRTPDLLEAICPASGIAAAYLMWALTAEITERLLAMNKKPSVLISNHLRGAAEHNRVARSQYTKQGY